MAGLAAATKAAAEELQGAAKRAAEAEPRGAGEAEVEPETEEDAATQESEGSDKPA